MLFGILSLTSSALNHVLILIVCVCQTFWWSNLAQPRYQLGFWLTEHTSAAQGRCTPSGLHQFGRSGYWKPKGLAPPRCHPSLPWTLSFGACWARWSCCLCHPYTSENRNFHTLAKAPRSCWIFTLVEMHFDSIENTTEQCWTDEWKKGECELADRVGWLVTELTGSSCICLQI